MLAVPAGLPDSILNSGFLQRPIILSGHQPSLFHPGVWLKNFILSSAAKAVGGTAINLVIDNDLVRTPAIRVPCDANTAPKVVDVPYDEPAPEVPWEERWVRSPDTLRQFAINVRAALGLTTNRSQGLLVDRVWSRGVDFTQRRLNEFRERILRVAAGRFSAEKVASISGMVRLGDVLASARHDAERDFGLQTYEASLGKLCHGPGFLAFVEFIFARHREFHAIHNAVLAEYRIANHIRSHTHPVPGLAVEGDWFEMPFWNWNFKNPQRRRVFVRQVGQRWQMTDHGGRSFQPTAEASARKWGCWRDIESTSERLRPRALITTMYARLVLSDLFIHGIGGAKYDELTDEIIRRFFGIEPPAYLTATATFRLPIDRPQVTIEDVRECVRRIRDVRFRPESFVGDALVAREPRIAEQLQSLAADKREYVRTHTLRSGSEEAFHGVDRINRAMHELLAPVEEHLRREHARLVEDARRTRLLGSREFSFVLFPEEYLVPRLLALAQVPA